MRKLNNIAALSALAITLVTVAAASAETASQYIDDSTITTKVKAALLADGQLKATRISVETNQGTVQLNGNVDSKTQESEALKVASHVSGVKSVQDNMTVGSTSEQEQ